MQGGGLIIMWFPARLQDKLMDAKIHTEVLGSDHCPVELEINL